MFKSSGLFKKALFSALAVVILDQLSKQFILGIFESNNIEAIELTKFFNIAIVWNKGVSFGMFSNFEYSRIIFLIVTIILVVILLFWLKGVKNSCSAIAIGLIIGGAFGNFIDRLIFGAVFDFLDFHLYGYHWPAFNIADSAICVGASLLIYWNLFLEKENKS